MILPEEGAPSLRKALPRSALCKIINFVRKINKLIKFELLTLTETNSKWVGMKVSWCGVNGITEIVPSIERIREGVAILMQ